mgnify:CR=1 FL=1
MEGAGRETDSLLTTAVAYAERGWSVIPIGPNKLPHIRWKIRQVRRATVDELLAYWTRWPSANVGVVTGSISGGLVVVDADDDDAVSAVLDLLGDVVPGIVETACGGHYWFTDRTAQIHRNGVRLAGRKLDVRGEGGYVVAPPSVHSSGHVYRWVNDGGTPPSALPPLPQSLSNLITAQKPTSSAYVVPTSTGRILEGNRNSTLASLAGVMRSRGMSVIAIEAALLAENSVSCDPPLGRAEVRGIAASIGRYQAGDRPNVTVFRDISLELRQIRRVLEGLAVKIACRDEKDGS